MDEELDLIKQISNFHNIILSAAKYYEPHRITNYLHNLAKMFHNYWGLGKIDFDKKILLENNIELTKSRILLVDTIGATIKKGLSILKISCPDSM